MVYPQYPRGKMQSSAGFFFLFTLVTFTFQLVCLDCGAVVAKWLSIEFWCMCLADRCMLPCVAIVVSYLRTDAHFSALFLF